jgi:nicotinate phosphoribosyltransferase
MSSRDPRPGFDPASSLLLTDLYELNMYDAYLEADMTEPAVFEFFVRRLPPSRGFLIACGLETVLDFVEAARFPAAELEWLARTGRFSSRMLDRLERFRFSGDIHAVPEGRVFFADEPILRVTAPLPEAQLLESRIINLLHYQSLIASKAARMVMQAPGKVLLDFGLRRAHGAEAGMLAARAAYLAGFTGSATVLAEVRYGVPAFGTMAHSFIQAHADEARAFEHFARAKPDQVILLVDTYDTEAGTEKVVALAPVLARAGITVRGVRLDSGDLAEHAVRVRRILDAGGLEDVRIFASGGIDEHALASFRAGGAPIDGYGIGTSLTTSSDCPSLDCAYKLQAYAGQPRRKLSEGKATWPGAKQIYRRYRPDGRMAGDILTVEGDDQAGEPLVVPVMRGGERLGPAPTLEEIRARVRTELARLPAELAPLASTHRYAVEVSPALRALADRASLPARRSD